MKKQNKVISFILVLSLLFSSMIFVVGAEGSASTLNDITNTEFYEPTASFTKVEESGKAVLHELVKAPFTSMASGYSSNVATLNLYGGNEIDIYAVHSSQEGRATDYALITPSATAKENNKLVNNLYFGTVINSYVSYTDPSSAGYVPSYYVFEYDVATESKLFPLGVCINARRASDNTGMGGHSFEPAKIDACLNMTPGVFHHITVVCDINMNTAYVYLDDNYVTTINSGIMTDTMYGEFKAGAQLKIEGARIQTSVSLSNSIINRWGSFDDLTFCVDNISDRIFLNNSELSAYAGTSSIKDWSENKTSQTSAGLLLPDLIEINGKAYNNTVEANALLNTYELGTEAEVLRSCYGGDIVVNCDAAIAVPVGAEVNLVEGQDVNLVKGEGSLWHGILKSFKHSAYVVSKNVSDITSPVRLNKGDNLISQITQQNAVNEKTFTEEQFAKIVSILSLTDSEKALFTVSTSGGKTTYTLSRDVINNSANSAFIEKFTNHSIDGNIVRTNHGNEYLIVQDNSGATDDFPFNVHYQVNANTPLVRQSGVITNAAQYQIGGHDFVVFEQDIYSESTFINIYSAFNLRTTTDLPLFNTPIFANKISITPEKWYHITYVGDVATGNSYIFLNGDCIAKIEDGLYDEASIGKMAVSLGYTGDASMMSSYQPNDFAELAAGITAEQRTTCINSMVLASFRTMQIAGENTSGIDLTPDMSAASDNYYLRWADANSSMTELIDNVNSDLQDGTLDGNHNISSWNGNIYTDSYKTQILPERAVIAIINGTPYYDTTSINEQLDNSDYTKPLQEITLYREYIGTIVVNCRATVQINGINSNVEYNEYDANTNPTGCIVDKMLNPVEVYMNTPADKPQGMMQVENKSPVAQYKEVAATGSEILSQWKYTGSTKPNNLYTSHSISSTNTKKTQIFNSYDNTNKVANYVNDFTYPIYDKGAQTHTIAVNQSMSNAITVNLAGSCSSTSSWGQKTYTVTLNTTVTEKQYYLVMEFDIAQVAASSGAINVKNTVGGTSYTIADISSYLSGNNGEFNHITIIGCVDATLSDITTKAESTSESTATFSSTQTVTYSLTYKVFVNNALKATVNSVTNSATELSSWQNVVIENTGRSVTMDNIYVGIASVQNVKTLTTSKSGNSSIIDSTARSRAMEAYNNDAATKTITAAEQSSNAGTTTDNTSLNECFATTGTLNDGTYGQTSGYTKPSTVTNAAPDFNTQTTESYPNGTFSTVPDPNNPKVDYPIAVVDGVLYYQNGATDANGNPYPNTEDKLKELLEKPHEEQRQVTFLKEPTLPITIVSNAQVDRNGLACSSVTLGNGDCVVAEGTHVSTVINLSGTTVVATMNGVDYFNNQTAELQAAVTAAKSVEISFYSVPSTPIKITSVASINTNGIIKDGVTREQLFTTDEINYVITAADGAGAEFDYTIIAKIRSATVEVRVVKDDVVIDSVKMTANFGTDIEQLLTERGLMSGVFVVNGQQLNVTNWDNTPSGVIDREDNGGTSAYIYTARVDSAKSKEITKKYAYVTADGITESDSEADVKNWFSANSNGTIVFFDDLTLTGASQIELKGGKSVHLNGHSLTFNVMSLSSNKPTGVHGFVVGGATNVSFFGDGAINYTTNAGTNAFVFANYDFAGKISFSGLTINASCAIAQIRSGSFEFTNCVINSYNAVASNVFSIGEQYNGNYSKNPMSLTLQDCDVTFRYYSTSSNHPLISSKIVTTADDPAKTVIIDGCTIKSQGSIIAANDCENSNETPNAYLDSNLKLYINNSDITAQAIIKGMIKPNSVFFCDDIRTNVTSTAYIAFATDLVEAKTSDGVYGVLYTSHDYAAITWSDGTMEYWASGSTPNRYENRFDSITAGGIGADQENSYYDSTGTSFPFGLFANLTLSDMIGFNVYIPTTLKNGTAVSTSDVKVYLDGKEIAPNTYPGTSTVRTSIVAAATGYGQGYCYDYTLSLAPQDAAKSFTIVIVYGYQCVSRTISVADYAKTLIDKGTNEKNLALLSVTLAYIEQATKFAGNTYDLTKIKSLRGQLGTKTATIEETAAPNVTHTQTEADFAKYFGGVQINVKENGAFRFRLLDGVSADGFAFYIANDKNDDYELREHEVITVDGITYLELSLRAYEMARSIKITKGGEYDLYSLYQCYNATKVYADKTIDVSGVSYTPGYSYEYKASLTLVETIYHYARICDKYLDRNPAEYQPAN